MDSGSEDDIASSSGEEMNSEKGSNNESETVLSDVSEVRSIEDMSTDDQSECIEEEHSTSFEEDDEEPTSSVPDDDFCFYEKVLAVLSFVGLHNLPHTAVDELLQILQMFHSESTKKELDSVYQLRKWLSGNTVLPVVYYICPNLSCSATYCESSLPDQCSEPQCKHTLNKTALKKSGHFFLYVSIREQIRRMLEVSEIEQILSDFLQGTVQEGISNPDCMKNIFASQRYSMLKKLEGSENFDTHYDLLTLNLNLDGVETAKSASNSLYPLQVIINELPEYVRRKAIITPLLFLKNRENNVVFMQHILIPFIKEMQSLFLGGVTWYSHKYSREVKTRVIAYSMNSDSVMKPDLLCVLGHSGLYSCPVCVKEGKSVKKGKGHTTVQLPEVKSKSDRTLVTYDARSVSNIVVGQLGYEGFPILLALPVFPVFKCHSIDYMHGIASGVFNKIFKLIVKTRGEKFSVGQAGERLVAMATLNLKGHSSIERGPRCTSEEAHYKSSEWRDWGFIFFVPMFEVLVQEKLLDIEYFRNFVDLIIGVSLLINDEISPEDRRVAKEHLERFLIKFRELYGDEHCGFNFHLISHLEEYVCNLGPLWCTSLFIHEGFNKTLIRCYRVGTKGLLLQIAERLQLRNAVLEINSHVRKRKKDSFSCKLAEKMWFHMDPIEEPASVIVSKGLRSLKLGNWRVPGSVKEHLASHARIDQDAEISLFERVNFRGKIFTTSSYYITHNYKKVDYFFFDAKCSQFGRIDYIVSVKNETFLVYSRLDVVNDFNTDIFPENIVKIKHLNRCKSTPNICVLKLCSSLRLRKCVCITLSDKSFMLGFLPFSLEAS